MAPTARGWLSLRVGCMSRASSMTLPCATGSPLSCSVTWSRLTKRCKDNKPDSRASDTAIYIIYIIDINFI